MSDTFEPFPVIHYLDSDVLTPEEVRAALAIQSCARA